MAIIIANDGDKTVATIAERNAITKRFDGMQVTVLDAIADILTGGGEACYQWNDAFSRWMLIWKTSKDNLNFITETKTISLGKVTADYLPSNGTVWDCFVTNGTGVLVADVTAPSITGQQIDLQTNDHDGLTLTYTYGYGLIEAAVYANSDRNWITKSSNYTAFAGDRIMVDTSSAAVTITLPAAPFVGAYIKVIDYASNFTVNPATVARNGEKIAGVAEDLLLDASDYGAFLIYSGAAKGWIYGV